jgi:predicted DCC family thiol-disulfide oxidoreductase YuxK
MAIVIYDADCGFCRFSLAILLSATGALRPLPLGTAEADELLADLTEEQRNASWHVIYDDGTRASAGAALAPALFARFPRTTERAYGWVAAHRGLLGRIVPARARRWADRVIARSHYP